MTALESRLDRALALDPTDRHAAQSAARAHRRTMQPRPWQAAAFPLVMDAIAARRSGVVQAVMGSGKSFLIGWVCGAIELGLTDVVVVTTSTQRLVEQLAETIGQHVGGRVGRYYSDAKEVRGRDYIVCCNPSAQSLGEELKRQGRTVNVLIVDEAHRSECATMLAAVKDQLCPGVMIGFTATPFRSSQTEELSLFECSIYEYGARQAMRDGVVVPYRVIPWTGAECSVDDACVSMIREMTGPGIVSADDIADAEAYADVLREAGISSAPIHSKQAKIVQDSILKRLQSGDLQTAVHVSMLQEGVDFPWLAWICLRRKGMSRVRFPQEVGRALRAAPGKTLAYILDPHDHFGSFSLNVESVLQGQGEAPTTGVMMQITGTRDGLWLTEDIEPACWGFASGARVIAHWGKNKTRVTLGRSEREGVAACDRDAWLVRSVPTHLELCRSAPTEREDCAGAAVAAAHESVDAECLDLLTAYLRRVVMDLDNLGLCERMVASRSWRSEEPTERQVGMVRRLFGPLRMRVDAIPEMDRAALREACRALTSLRRGAVSDLISIMMVVEKSGWPQEMT